MDDLCQHDITSWGWDTSLCDDDNVSSWSWGDPLCDDGDFVVWADGPGHFTRLRNGHMAFLGSNWTGADADDGVVVSAPDVLSCCCDVGDWSPTRGSTCAA